MLASFDNVKVEYAKVSAREGAFAVVNLDYDQAWLQDDGSVIRHKSRPSRNTSAKNVLGLPATARFVVQAGARDSITLHEDLQWWMHSLCVERVPSINESEAKSSWRSLMSGKDMQARFFTDFAGSETNADYINGTNLDKEAMRGKPLSTGGGVLKILENKRIYRIGGTNCYKHEAINPFGNYRQYHPSTHFWLFFYPTTSRREGVITRDRALIENLSIPFSQYRDNAVMPVFGAEGNDFNFVPVDRVRILGVTEKIPSPYVMPFGQYKPNPYERF